MFTLAAGYHWWFPLDASAHGNQIDRLIVLTHWFMAALFVGWGVYFIYCLARFRSRPGHQPTTQLPKAKASKYAEVVVVLVEAVLLLGFSIPIWARVRGASHAPNPADALVVRVVAEQFAWNFHYPGKDGIFGQTDTTLISTENSIGLDPDDGAAKDDIVTINEMHVPVERDVLVHLTSKDVIHSFGVPLLRVKQDVIPGISSPIWFRATQTTDEIRSQLVQTYATHAATMVLLKDHVPMADYQAPDGTHILKKGTTVMHVITAEQLAKLAAAGIDQIKAAPRVPTQIACAQLCGIQHYQMRGYLRIDTVEKYAEWVAEQEQRLLEEEDVGY